MKFAEIIRNAGLNPCDFKTSAYIETHVYDGKDRLSPKETVYYNKPFFEENEGSLLNFIDFLTGLENEKIESMNVKVDEFSVILFYKTERAIVFSRHPSMDPMDYMG